MDSSFWVYIKSMTYESPIESEEDVVAELSVAAGNLHDMPDIFVFECQSLRCRCESCITVSGRSFEYLKV